MRIGQKACIQRTATTTVHERAHGSTYIRRSQSLFQSKGLDLFGRRRNGRFLENGSNAFTSRHGIVQYLIVGFIARLATQVVAFPCRQIEKGFKPFLGKQFAGIMSHFFTGNVHHGWGLDFLIRWHHGMLGRRTTRSRKEGNVPTRRAVRGTQNQRPFGGTARRRQYCASKHGSNN